MFLNACSKENTMLARSSRVNITWVKQQKQQSQKCRPLPETVAVRARFLFSPIFSLFKFLSGCFSLFHSFLSFPSPCRQTWHECLRWLGFAPTSSNPRHSPRFSCCHPQPIRDRLSSILSRPSTRVGHPPLPPCINGSYGQLIWLLYHVVYAHPIGDGLQPAIPDNQGSLFVPVDAALSVSIHLPPAAVPLDAVPVDAPVALPLAAVPDDASLAVSLDHVGAPLVVPVAVLVDPLVEALLAVAVDAPLGVLVHVPVKAVSGDAVLAVSMPADSRVSPVSTPAVPEFVAPVESKTESKSTGTLVIETAKAAKVKRPQVRLTEMDKLKDSWSRRRKRKSSASASSNKSSRSSKPAAKKKKSRAS